MHFDKNKGKKIRKYIFYNKRKNISYKYDGDIDLCAIAEWIACGFFLGDKNFTKQEYRQEADFNC